jgi:hypothetical protein
MAREMPGTIYAYPYDWPPDHVSTGYWDAVTPEDMADEGRCFKEGRWYIAHDEYDKVRGQLKDALCALHAAGVSTIMIGKMFDLDDGIAEQIAQGNCD